MPITLYHNPCCSKSAAALTPLEECGVRPRMVEYLKTPPDKAQLARILSLLGMRPRDLLRPKEARNASVDPELDDAALIAAMVANPGVIERPIAVSEDDARLAVRRIACSSFYKFIRGAGGGEPLQWQV